MNFLVSRKNLCVSPVFLTMVAALAGVMLSGCGNREKTITLDELIAQQEQIKSRAVPPAPAPEATQINKEMGPMRLGADDLISIQATSTDTKSQVLPTEVRVGTNGTAIVPLVGQMQLAGLTLEETEAAIRKAYAPNYMLDPVVVVKMIDPRMTHVVVLGEVGVPGMVELPRGNRDILHAITAAGGVVPTTGGGITPSSLTYPAGIIAAAAVTNASGKITLRRIREGGKPQRFDLREPEGLRQALTIDPLEDGDVVYVEGGRPNNSIFVLGLVVRPSRQDYPPGTRVTLLQAIASAGGLDPFLFPSKGTLIRRLDGHDVHVRLDLTRIREGCDPDIEFAPGDIVDIPWTLGARVLRFINVWTSFDFGASVRYEVIGTHTFGDTSGTSSPVVFLGGGGTPVVTP